jgi:hypothetical protein
LTFWQLQEADKRTVRTGGHHVANELAALLEMNWVHCFQPGSLAVSNQSLDSGGSTLKSQSNFMIPETQALPC